MASILKVDTIQDQAGNNIINESANVITIGASGDTITIPSGASMSGFTSTGIDDNASSTAITIDSSQNVGINATSPTEKLTVETTTGISIKGTGSGNGIIKLVSYAGSQNAEAQIQSARGNTSGTDSRLKFLTNNGTSTLERIDINDNGDISFYEDTGTTAKLFWDASAESLGIGTSSPQQLINIESTSNAKIRYGYSSTVYGEFGRKSNGVHEWSSYENGGDLTFGTSQSNGSTTERMRIEANGLVRIKNTSHTNSLITNNHNLIIGNESSGAHGLAILAPTNENSYVSFFDSGNSGSFRGTLNYNHSDDSLRTYVNGSERMRIDSSGNVGIGTSSPSEKLSVTGNMEISGSIISTVNNSLRIISGGNATNAGANLTLYGGTEASSPGQFRFRNGTTVLMQINNAGKIFTRQTAQFDDCVTIGGAQFTGDFQIELSGLTTLDGSNWRQFGMRLTYAGTAGDLTNEQHKDVFITVRGLSSWSAITPRDSGGGTIAITLDSATSTASTFTVTTPGSTTVGAYVATLFANDNSTMECNG